jgi:hypothetical protein
MNVILLQDANQINDGNKVEFSKLEKGGKRRSGFTALSM